MNYGPIQWKRDALSYDLLNIGGWYDIFSRTTIDLVDQVRARSRDREVRRNQFVVIGPWGHGVGGRKTGELDFGAEATFKVGEWQFKWFEYWLKGRETGVEDWPAYYLFVMGDNRPESSDSRMWGSLPKENIVGRAMVRLLPFSQLSLFPGSTRPQ